MDSQELNYYELRHDQLLGTNGLVLGLDVYSTHTNPQFILTPLDVLGASTDGNISLSYPIIRSRSKNLSIQAQFDVMSNSSSALGDKLYDDEIRDLTLTSQYNDTLWKGENSASLVYDKGFNILGAGKGGFRSRLGAAPSFNKLIFTFSRQQYLGERFAVYGLVTTQYSGETLFAAETMIFGGPYLGRGYDWAQFTGDSGIAGKTEFRINTAPDLAFLKQVQYYAFYDVGKLYNRVAGGTAVSGASAGVGLRAFIIKHFNAEGFIGKPLTTPDASQIIKGQSGHLFEAYFQLTAYV